MAEVTEKSVAQLTRRQLEAEAKTIDDKPLREEPSRLSDQGLRSAVRLHRRRRGLPE